MPRITAQDLREFLSEEPVSFYLLQGIEETDDAWYLGQLGVSKVHPSWRFGYWGALSDSARCHVIPLSAKDTGLGDGHAAIFRQFDQSKFSPEPSEMFAGWVRSVDEAKLAEWTGEMNQHLVDMLAVKHQPGSPDPVCPQCGEDGYLPKSPAKRVLDGDRYRLSFAVACSACGNRLDHDVVLDYFAPSGKP